MYCNILVTKPFDHTFTYKIKSDQKVNVSRLRKSSMSINCKKWNPLKKIQPDSPKAKCQNSLEYCQEDYKSRVRLESICERSRGRFEEAENPEGRRLGRGSPQSQGWRQYSGQTQVRRGGCWDSKCHSSVKEKRSVTLEK